MSKVLIILLVVVVLAIIVFAVMRMVAAGKSKASGDRTSDGGDQPPGRVGQL